MQKIISNKARCRKCNTIAESTNRHHLCFCQCGAIFVDGGTSYLRRGGEIANIEDLSEFAEVSEKTSEVQNERSRT